MRQATAICNESMRMYGHDYLCILLQSTGLVCMHSVHTQTRHTSLPATTARSDDSARIEIDKGGREKTRLIYSHGQAYMKFKIIPKHIFQTQLVFVCHLATGYNA